MSLFPELINPQENLLPFDGIVNDYGCIYDATTAQIIFDYLMQNTPWQHDEYIKHFAKNTKFNPKSCDKTVVYDTNNQPNDNPAQDTKHITTVRQVAWYAGHKKNHTYAGTPKPVYMWTPALLKIKALIEQKTGQTFNACLLNLYPSGTEGMSWHSDDADDIIQDTAIASLSFGAQRKFMFKHKRTKKRIDLWLASGQLIVMRGNTQKNWLHAVPKTKKVNQPRINLTFRNMA